MDKCDVYNIVDKCIVRFYFPFNFPFNSPFNSPFNFPFNFPFYNDLNVCCE